MAAPNQFQPEFIVQAKKLAALGHTDQEIAQFFGVSVRSVHRWKIDHPAFAKALKIGKRVADQRVERALFQRAVGFTCDEDHVELYHGKAVVTPMLKQYPPDTVACIFWLKNRKPEEWRDKQDHEHKGTILQVHLDPTDSAL